MTRAYIFDDPFLCADYVTIFKYVLCEVDIGQGLLVLDLLDGTVNESLWDMHDYRN